mmetsp:Transcript_1508/g.4656  ORF Transcript_1508/g.4656 Transcript_1508/m.4656 type:complete len:229 (-) Transcript_1508:172-858(-)
MPVLLEGHGERAEGAGQPPRKLSRNATDQEAYEQGKQKRPDFKGGNKQLVAVLLKQVLKLSQEGRDMASAVVDTLVGKAEAPECVSLLSQTAAYAAQAKAAGKAHQLGPPHVQAFGGLLRGLAKVGAAVGQRNLVALAAVEKEFEGMTWQQAAEEVRVCKLSKMYRSEYKRLTLVFGGSEVAARWRSATMGALEQTGWERKYGRAPPAHQERELQAWLEALVAGKGGE